MATMPTAGISNQTPVAGQTTPPAVATSVPAKTNQSATKSSTPTKIPTDTPSVPASSSSAATPMQTQNAAPTVAPTPTKTATPTPTSNSVNGTFTGPVVNVSYGNVQVQITVTNGKITDAQALIAPTGKNDKYTRMALPQLKQQTLAAQSTNIQGASGASYTTYGWRKSLQGAMAKAGL
jgi:uncharacterized protein with FMN-binding domain